MGKAEKGFIILDFDSCIGCGSCKAACMQAHSVESEILLGNIEGGVYLPFVCKQCRAPLCGAACPTQALRKDEKTGITVCSPFLCVGCLSCVYACPFGVLPSQPLRHIIQKCDLCKDRPGGPCCVASCPSEALRYIKESKEVEVIFVTDRFVSSASYRRPI